MEYRGLEGKRGREGVVTSYNSDDEEYRTDPKRNTTDDLHESLQFLFHESVWLFSLGCIHCNHSNRSFVTRSNNNTFPHTLRAVSAEESNIPKQIIQ